MWNWFSFFSILTLHIEYVSTSKKKNQRKQHSYFPCIDTIDTAEALSQGLRKIEKYVLYQNLKIK
jgi:hypothetical protein